MERRVIHDIRHLGERQLADSRRWHPKLHRDDEGLARHLAMGLAEEAGEVLGIFKKADRGDFSYTALLTDPVRRHAVVGELADVTMYLTALAALLNVDLGAAVVTKASENDVRFHDG